MTPDLLFAIASPLALAGWATLTVAPLAPRWLLPLGGIAIPLALCLLYALGAALWLPGAPGGFDSLPNVMRLFTDPGATTAGWVHFLAFDLLIGGWITRDARARRVPHLAILPCLYLTLMVGPVGLLAYLALRAATAAIRARLLRKETPA
ncbi:MAG: ABA4-like family protein [Pseudomonadota bacterium]